MQATTHYLNSQSNCCTGCTYFWQDSKVHTKFHLSPITALTHLTSLIDRRCLIYITTDFSWTTASKRETSTILQSQSHERQWEMCLSRGNYGKWTIPKAHYIQWDTTSGIAANCHNIGKPQNTQVHKHTETTLGYMNIKGASIECHWVF